jgi:ABC-2 type transport system permease protein
MAQLAVLAPAPAGARPGAARWGRAYWLMTRWQLAGLRAWFAVLAAIQVLAGAGAVLAVALFFHRLPASAALFMATGVPVVNLILVGILLGPQLVAAQKLQQGYEFMRTLPVPWPAAAAAWYTVCLIAGLPGAALAVIVAVARYGIGVPVSPAIAPAVLLTAFTGTMLGYALGHALPDPMLTRLLSQVLLFAVFGFTPVAFPARQLPGWLAGLNEWLPFGHMAVIVRAALTRGVTGGIAGSYLIVAAWGMAAALAAGWVLGRRR